VEVADHNAAVQRLFDEIQLFDQLYRFYSGEKDAFDSSFTVGGGDAPADVDDDEFVVDDDSVDEFWDNGDDEV